MALDIKLDPVTGGWLMTDDGDLDQIAGADEVAQHLHTTLETPRGQDPIDTEFGLPYLETILVKNPDLGAIATVISAAIAGHPQIQTLDDIDFDFDIPTSTLTVTFSATTTEGIVTNITIPFII